jgi:hypothetical protein
MFLVKKTLFIFVNNQQNQLICQKLVGDTTVARFSICLNIIVIRFNIWLNIHFSAFFTSGSWHNTKDHSYD